MKHILEVDGVRLNFSGRNGQGKSCLMKIIYGILRPESKSIRFDGKTVFELAGRSDLLLYLPQFNFIPSFLSLERIFKDFCLDISEFETHFPEFISRTKFKISEFSGGERRLVELYVINYSPYAGKSLNLGIKTFEMWKTLKTCTRII